MSYYYILNGHKPVLVSFTDWAFLHTSQDWQVARKRLFNGKVCVSTVFLGIDYQTGRHGPPLLFHTMVFGGPLDESQERCSTWEQAEKMHKVWIKKAADAGL